MTVYDSSKKCIIVLYLFLSLVLYIFAVLFTHSWINIYTLFMNEWWSVSKFDTHSRDTKCSRSEYHIGNIGSRDTTRIFRSQSIGFFTWKEDTWDCSLFEGNAYSWGRESFSCLCVHDSCTRISSYRCRSGRDTAREKQWEKKSEDERTWGHRVGKTILKIVFAKKEKTIHSILSQLKKYV